MFEQRLKIVKEKLIKEKLDGVLISSVANITYLTGYANFSEGERESYLIITKDQQIIITDGRYSEAVKKQVPHFTLFERGYSNQTEDLLKKLKKQINILAIEEDSLTVAEYKLVKKHYKNIKHFEIGSIRSLKSDEEIRKIQEASKIGDLAFQHILKHIKIGVSEKEIARKLESFIKEKGAEFSFPAIVAFGKNAAIPHHHTGQTVLGPKSSLGREGQFVLLDFGVKVENYCSDMTRTVFFGKPDSKQKKMYETVLMAQQKAVEFINSSIKSGKQIISAEVDKAARDYIISQGFPSIPHSLGHGIGLDVHEHPHISQKSKEILKEGMVFSIEPGIYIPEFGGVRIEDLYVLEGKGLKQITNSPKRLSSI